MASVWRKRHHKGILLAVKKGKKCTHETSINHRNKISICQCSTLVAMVRRKKVEIAIQVASINLANCVCMLCCRHVLTQTVLYSVYGLFNEKNIYACMKFHNFYGLYFL